MRDRPAEPLRRARRHPRVRARSRPLRAPGACAAAWLTNPGGLRPFATIVAFAGALFGFAFSVYLTYVEGWILEAWCIYCITSASLLSALALTWAGIAFHLTRSPADWSAVAT